jgi:hypothetical protein
MDDDAKRFILSADCAGCAGLTSGMCCKRGQAAELERVLAARDEALKSVTSALNEATPILEYFAFGRTSFSGEGTPMTAFYRCRDAQTALAALSALPAQPETKMKAK